MAKKIAIELEINGVKQSIKTINDLEKSIQDLTEELKDAEIGSQNFNKLTNELNRAKSELKDFEKQFEGIETQQKTQAYLAFGEAVVSSILLAQEALRTFGVENEQVNNAVEKSTQAINLAVQARIVVEGLLEARILATSIAQKALNTSIVAGNRVLRVLFTTIAANPIGALLTGIGLLTAAFITLSDTTEENTEDTKENNEELERQNRLREAQAAVISQAEQEIREARARGTQGLRDEQLVLKERQRLLDNEVRSLEQLAQTTLVQLNQQKIAGGNITFLNSKYEDLVNQLQLARVEAEGNAQVLAGLNQELINIDKNIAASKFNRFNKTLAEVNKRVEELNRNIVEFGETPTPKVIEDLENLLALQLDLQKAAEDNRKTLGDVFNDYLKAQNDALLQVDNFGERYERFRDTLTEGFRSGDIEFFGKKLEEVRKESFDAQNEFNSEQRLAIASLLSQYKTAFDGFINLGVSGSTEFGNVVDPLLENIAQILELQGKIRFEEVPVPERSENEIQLIAPQEAGFDELEETADRIDRTFVVLNDRIREIVLSEEILQTQTKGFFDARQVLIDEFQKEIIKQTNFQQLAAENRAEAEKAALDAATKAADIVITNIENIAQTEDEIRGVFDTFENLQVSIRNNSNEVDVLLGLILENFDKVRESFDIMELDPTSGSTEVLQANYDRIVKFFEDINAESILQLFKTEEDKQKIVEFFLQKRQEAIDEAAKNETDTAKETAKTQQEIFEEQLGYYQQVLGSLSQLSGELSNTAQLQIERVENQTEQLLENIVGDTEQAEKLRTEIRERSEKEILEIERKSRLRELQFSKIQALADLSQALINSLKLPPPFNAIQASLITAAGGLQISNIQSQINDLQSVPALKDGGMVVGEGTGTSDSIPALLSNGEFVINAKSTQKFLPLLELINKNNLDRKFQNGGFVSNNEYIPSTNIQNIFDDSRIIKELKTLRNQPVRAYVFEREITKSQEVEKRLRELSKL